jgi:dCMP deaminase
MKDKIEFTNIYVTGEFNIPDWTGAHKQNKMDIIRLKQAQVESENSNCVKHSVGCIITDVESKILSSGYNGTPRGHQNCCDKFPNFKNEVQNLKTKIEALHMLPEGSWTAARKMLLKQEENKLLKLMSEHHEWSKRNENHAEVNAMLRSDPKSRIGGTVYVNLQPCEECAKMIAGSGVSRVVYGKAYERSDKSFSESFFGASMIKYIHIPDII